METRPDLFIHRQAGSGIGVLTLVDDQYLSCLPPIKRGLTRPYALYLFIEIGLTWRDCSP